MLIIVTAVHLMKLRVGSNFQIIMTVMKFGLIFLLAISGLFLGTEGSDFSLKKDEWSVILSPGFAAALFYVNYAYAGWNAASYVAGEINKPAKNVPRALLLGPSLFLSFTS